MNSKTNETFFPVNLCPVSSNHHLITHRPTALTSPTGHMMVQAAADLQPPRGQSAGTGFSATPLLRLEQRMS